MRPAWSGRKALGAARAVLLLVLGALHGAAGAAPAAEGARPLRFGVFPIVSTVELFRRYVPLRAYLAARLGREVRLETARDFPTFVRRTAARRYDVVVTAPHFALLAASPGPYEIRGSLRRTLEGVVVVHRASRIRGLAALAGRLVATPPEPALITLAGRRLFAVHGLTGTRAPRWRAYRSHNAAYEAVAGGDADAAVVSINALRKALEREAPLREIARTPPLPNTALLVARDLPERLRARIEAAFVGADRDADGRLALQRAGLPGWRPARRADYEVLRPYLAGLDLR